MREPITESIDLAKKAADVAGSKKAEDIVILDMRQVCTYTDFFVICSGRSGRQAQAISDEIRLQLKREGMLPLRVEGEQRGDWILLDYLGVVVHVFTPEARDFYRLDNLWKEAPRTEVAAG
ncbi:MAG: ribosome silencing factor [Gaiellales bacterium]|nr:MAG: ribosome silencing factor [Gaiellales bacterium]